MKDAAPNPIEARLAALRSLEILNTSSEEAFDRLTRLAAEAIGVPVATFALVDEARVWLKSRQGTDIVETPFEGAFCPHTIIGSDVLIIEDACADERFASSVLVAEHGVRFYAGAPVALATGIVVGTICAIDFHPHEAPNASATALLKGLAAAAGHLLDLRRELLARRTAEQALQEHAQLLELAEAMAGIGTWRLDLRTGALEQSPGLNRVYGLDANAAPSVDMLLAMYDPADRSHIVDMLERARTAGEGYTTDARLRRVYDGELRIVRAKASVERDGDGRPARLIGVLRDVTEERNAFRLLNEQCVEAERRAKRMSQLASTDLLTGLPNRRAFLARAEQALDNSGVALAVLDLDHFKAINDRHGHDAGDMALAFFARLCASVTDDTCFAGRIGGEEFALLMHGMDEEAATRRVEELRRLAADRSVSTHLGFPVRLTFSAGIALAETGEAWQDLFRRADEALYRAKHDGRDRTSVAA